MRRGLVGIGLLTAGAIIGLGAEYLLEMPAGIRRSCAMFNETYAEAQGRHVAPESELSRDSVPDHIQGRPESVWSKKNQKELEKAAKLARESATRVSRRSGDPNNRWWSVADALHDAAEKLDPSTGDRNEATIKKARAEALAEAVAVCTGR